ncbi:MAG: Putative type II secretion system protein F [Porticoccaceae bacterium UBA1117]|nr:MAG: Putative type II secretion system protein F [Porticoccaceae bacterium UBA1117]
MKFFCYKAYDRQGLKADGDLEAADIEHAKTLLDERGLMVVSLYENISLPSGLGFFPPRGVSAQELEFLTSELSLLLNSGVTIDRGLEVIKRNSSSAAQASLVASLHDAVRRGEALSDAMEVEAETFDALYINLVRLAESSGTLPKIFARLAEDIKFQSELRSKIISALTYPAAIFFVCILCIVFIFNYIVPQMSGLFEGLPEIPTYTAFLLGASDWMVNYQWFLLASIFVLAALLLVGLKKPSSARQIHQFLLMVPGVNYMSVLIERIRFNSAITMMLESGVLIDRCLEMALGSVKNQIFQQELKIAKERVKKGETLATALRASQLYPDFSLSLIEVGEESGNLGTVFSEISDRARREFEASIDRMTSLLEPLLILVMGGIVGGVVVIMLLSIVSVNDVGF